MNYFQLFDLPPAPVIDRSLLAKKYFELQRKNHPDFFTQSTEEQKEEALKQSADINKAFNIFQNKEKTMEYFLQTEGLIQQDEKYELSPAFLMEMMEINEALTEETVEQGRRKIEEQEMVLLAGIAPVLENYAKADCSREDLLKLKAYYYKKKYLNRILDRLGG